MFDSLSQYFRKAATPSDTRIFAIGDAHGYDDALERILDQIDRYQRGSPTKNAIIVFLGDFTGKGPHSRRVLDLMCRQRELEKSDGIKRVFLIGNHDYALKMFMNTPLAMYVPREIAFFLDHGGLDTLQSYGISLQASFMLTASSHVIKGTNLIVDKATLSDAQHALRKAMSPAHKDIYNSAQVYFESGDYFFVHAAVDPALPLGQMQNEDMMIGLDHKSKKFPELRTKMDKIIVHGHSIALKPYSVSNQIGVDTGVYKNGVLSCAVLEGKKVTFLQAKTDLPLYSPTRALDIIAPCPPR